MKILNVVGARPNFMKISPIVEEMESKGIFQRLLHTGQHYDIEMSKVFFDQLDLPKPDIYLGVGSGSHAEQTAQVMIGFEKALLKEKPGLVVVVGDVNSTLACSLVAVKLHVPVAHVESGLRSNDWTMPEEVNRVLTDRLSALLFTPSKDANENLRCEGITQGVHLVGNIMIDTLKQNLQKAQQTNTWKKMGLDDYCLVTLHRPENVDDPRQLARLVELINIASEDILAVFAVHPRTRKNLQAHGLVNKLHNARLLEPQGYLEFINLQTHARFVLTDSGGVQEETTFLGVKCLTLRKNTERPITVEEGTNTVVDLDKNKLAKAIEQIENGTYKKGKIPELWDGKTAKRIVEIIENFG